MKKLFLILTCWLIVNQSFGQAKISELDIWGDSAQFGMVPVVIGGITYKTAGINFAFPKVDSIKLSNDSLFYWAHGGIKFFSGRVNGGFGSVNSFNTRTGAVTPQSGDYTTTMVSEGTNLYWTPSRFDIRFATKTSDSLPEGTVNQYFTSTRFNSSFGGKTTDALTEGLTNFYFTNARFDTRLSTKTTDALVEGTVNLYWKNSRFDTRFATKTTDSLPEGAVRQYYTNARFDSRFTSKTTDNLTEGTTNLYWTNARFDTRFGTKTTDNLTEGTTNKYYTDARVETKMNSALVAGTNITVTYNAGAHTFTIAQSGGAGFAPVITSPASGQVIEYNGSNWVNYTLTKADVGLSNVVNLDQSNAANLTSGTVPAGRYGSSTIPISAINATGTPSSTTVLYGNGSWGVVGTFTPVITSPTTGQILQYNGSNWVNISMPVDSVALTWPLYSNTISGQQFLKSSQVGLNSSGYMDSLQYTALNNKVGSITLNTENVLYNTGVSFSVSTGGAATGALSLKTQTHGLVFASHATTDATAPTFRALVATDLPSLDAAKITTGNFNTGRLGTGTATSTYMLVSDGAGNGNWVAQPTGTLPSQTGNSGKFLTTDGTNPSWATGGGTITIKVNGSTIATNATENYKDGNNTAVKGVNNSGTTDVTVNLKYDYTQDFFNKVNGINLTSTAGGGNNSTYVPTISGHMGGFSAFTGTGTTGQSFVGTYNSVWFDSATSNTWRCLWEGVKFTATDINQASILMMGFLNNYVGPVANTIPTNGCYFKYSDTLNSGNWILECANNGVYTDNNTSTAAVGTVAHSYEVVVFKYVATFYIDGTSVGTVTTNLPNGSSKVFGGAYNYIKQSGTADVNFSADRFRLSWHVE